MAWWIADRPSGFEGLPLVHPGFRHIDFGTRLKETDEAPVLSPSGGRRAARSGAEFAGRRFEPAPVSSAHLLHSRPDGPTDEPRGPHQQSEGAFSRNHRVLAHPVKPDGSAQCNHLN